MFKCRTVIFVLKVGRNRKSKPAASNNRVSIIVHKTSNDDSETFQDDSTNAATMLLDAGFRGSLNRKWNFRELPGFIINAANREKRINLVSVSNAKCMDFWSRIRVFSFFFIFYGRKS